MRLTHLLRLYPRAWRDRYGEEFLATVGHGPAAPAAGDRHCFRGNRRVAIGRCAARDHGRARGPEWRRTDDAEIADGL